MPTLCPCSGMVGFGGGYGGVQWMLLLMTVTLFGEDGLVLGKVLGCGVCGPWSRLGTLGDGGHEQLAWMRWKGWLVLLVWAKMVVDWMMTEGQLGGLL